MRVTFLIPGYVWGPSGGIRVVYEYANRLVSRGYHVTVVHPRRLKYPPEAEQLTTKRWVRQKVKSGLTRLRSKPVVDWQRVDKRVEMAFVPDSGSRNIPDGDIVFATGWPTVRSVLELPQTKGEKCYLIQGYESYHAPKELVDATWRAPLHKVVIAKWLMELGKELGCSDLTYIPNAIDHERYRLTQPIEGRARQISMVFSTVPVKGAADGIEALRIVREKYSDLRVVFFGMSRAPSWMPEWAEYHRNPSQEFIVDKIYNSSQIFVGTSWMEGFSLPPAEAGACGCAVATTDSMGVREFIENGVTGLLSPPKNPEALAENVCRLLGNEPLRVQLAKACQSVVSQFSWERSVDLLEGFLKGIMQNTRGTQERVLS
jgi:glycosyltransferase involved in cell wall biosynthesis